MRPLYLPAICVVICVFCTLITAQRIAVAGTEGVFSGDAWLSTEGVKEVGFPIVIAFIFGRACLYWWKKTYANLVETINHLKWVVGEKEMELKDRERQLASKDGAILELSKKLARYEGKFGEEGKGETQ